MNIIKYARIATQAWENFIREDNSMRRIHKYFHLRPTNSGVTVITTLSGYEMRGVTGIKKEEELLNLLKEIEENYEILTSLDESRRSMIMKSLKFPIRGKANNVKLEEKIQATMINTMSSDNNLKDTLGAKNCIEFVASELIFTQGKHRVDIVGYDDQDVYFFELKKERTKAVDQVKKYIEYYSENDNSAILKELLKNFPIKPVESFKRLIGVMVMEHAENSAGLGVWRELAKRDGTRILFYKPSLAYEDVA